MHPKYIFYPCFALILLTMFVWFTMLVRRAIHMKQYNIGPNDMPTRELADAKFGLAQIPNNNLMNLFEIPVLFYIATLAIYALQLVDIYYLWLGWAFVALRYLHSLIHLSYNNVLHRGLPYLASTTLLWLIWFRIGFQTVMS